jgi:hypothetical protein
MFTLTAKVWACGIGAVGASAVAVARRRVVPGVRDVLRLSAVGVGLLASSSLGVVVGRGAAWPVNVAAASCFVPLIVAVMCGIWGEGPLEFWPGLAGLGGAALIFPVTLRIGVAAYVGLLVPPFAVAVACVGCRRVARGIATEWAVALLFIGGEAGLAVLEFARKVSGGDTSQSFSPLAVALDLFIAGLVVVLVLQMDVRRYVSQYFIVPVLTVLEGLALLHGGVTIRLVAGLVLLAAGSVALWRRDTAESTPGLHLM